MDTDERLIPRYLLGLLSMDDTERLEQRFLSDDAFFDLVKTAEAEMISDYLRGVLSDSDRLQFARVYLTNTHLRKKVARAEFAGHHSLD